MAVITKRKNVSKSKSKSKSKSNSKTRKQFKSIRKNGMLTRKMKGGDLKNQGSQGSQGKKSAWKSFKKWLKPGMSKVAPSTPPLVAKKVPNTYNGNPYSQVIKAIKKQSRPLPPLPVEKPRAIPVPVPEKYNRLDIPRESRESIESIKKTKPEIFDRLHRTVMTGNKTENEKTNNQAGRLKFIPENKN